VYSQHLSHQVLVPLAGVSSDSRVNYSQTAGETAVEIVGCINYTFTQGFQQPCIKFSSLKPPQGTGVNVFPNPVKDYVTVELYGESARTFRVEFINITGTVVLSLRRSFSDNYWYREEQNIEHLVRGFYLVRILSEDGHVNRTFRIEKI
jgi:hypothetical protein